jgi:hypothetical protein
MTRNSFLFIPDISGFTEFVNDTEISHSRHVISELLDVILRSDELGMTVSEIEGDAVLFFMKDRTPTPSEIVRQSERTFHAFHSHLKRYERDRICPCGACRTAHQLTLKMVAHAGPVEIIRVQEFEKPYGADVILAHRLLKNEIPNPEYLLLTRELEVPGEELPPWAFVVPGSTTYETIGEVDYHHISLSPLRATVPDPPPMPQGARTARPISREVHVPLPVEETFELISNFDHRLRWTPGLDDLHYDPNRVNRAGTRHQCVIDGNLLDFETVKGDFGPERLVYGERILGKTPVIDPTLYYILEEMDGGTRVCAEVHYRPRPFPKSLLAPLFRVVFSRQLPKSLEALAELGRTRNGEELE